MITFDKPIETKSGEDIVRVWKELQEAWSVYKKAKFDHDTETVIEYATKIQELQEDIGLKKAEFPELKKQEIQNI